MSEYLNNQRQSAIPKWLAIVGFPSQTHFNHGWTPMNTDRMTGKLMGVAGIFLPASTALAAWRLCVSRIFLPGSSPPSRDCFACALRIMPTLTHPASGVLPPQKALPWFIAFTLPAGFGVAFPYDPALKELTAVKVILKRVAIQTVALKVVVPCGTPVEVLAEGAASARG